MVIMTIIIKGSFNYKKSLLGKDAYVCIEKKTI